MQSKTVPKPTRRLGSIRTQLIGGIGVILILASIIAITGYLSLRSLQTNIQTTLEEANRIRELSLKIENEFLLARQNEANLLTGERSMGFAAVTVYVLTNKRHLTQAREQIEILRSLVATAHDPDVRSLAEEIDKLPPLLDTYDTTFTTTVSSMEKRNRSSGLPFALSSGLTVLENRVANLSNHEFHVLLLRIRADEQSYYATGNQDYIDSVRARTDAFIQLANDKPDDLGSSISLPPHEVARQARNHLLVFNQLVELDQSITANLMVFQDVNADINEITDRISETSQAGLSRARAQLQAIIRQTTATLGLTAVLALGLGAVIAVVLAQRIIQPLNQLGQAARQMGQGNLAQPVTVTGGAELVTLADTFNIMAEQLRQTLAGLEQQVAERTREVERRAAQITTGAEISRFATSILDPDQLIVQIVQLIQERFDFYYVGLFMNDAANRYAVLQHGLGAGSAHDAGRIMKERGHRLEIGGQSMIGWACANKQARIALDVGEEAVRFANPLLPDTRSEMALPLRVGERAIGALSVQSTQGAAFDEGDIAALQGMADQIAVALENAHLFQQTQTTLKELDDANRLLARRGWEDYLARTEGLQAEFYPEGEEAMSRLRPHVLQLPLVLGNQPMGTLVMERSDSDPPWTEEETSVIGAIVQQALLAVDGARLFEESQRLAARERLINEITARIRSSTNIASILNSAVREISQVTGASYTAIDLELAEPD